MKPLLLSLVTHEAEALGTLLQAITYDDVATILERSEGISSETSERAYEIWSTTDDLHRVLLDYVEENEELREADYAAA